MIDPNDALLTETAVALWRARGRPTGRDLDIWLEAEALVLPALAPEPIVWSRWSADRRRLLTRHGRRELRIWDVAATEPVLVSRCRADHWSSAAAGPHGIVTVGFDWPCRLVVSDPRERHVVAAAEVATVGDYRRDVHDVVVSDDGRRAAVATRDVWTDAYDPSWHDRVTTLDVRSGDVARLRDPMGFYTGVERIALAADGSALALLTGTWAPGTLGVFVFDAASGNCHWHEGFDVGPGGGRRHLLLSGDGGTLVVIQGERLGAWDARTGALRQTRALEQPPDVAALSSDGCVVAGACAGAVVAWRLDRDAPPVVIEAPGVPQAIALEPDGSALLIAGPGPDGTTPRTRRVPLEGDGWRSA